MKGFAMGLGARCVTCHRGRPRPKLIEGVLEEQPANADWKQPWRTTASRESRFTAATATTSATCRRRCTLRDSPAAELNPRAKPCLEGRIAALEAKDD